MVLCHYLPLSFALMFLSVPFCLYIFLFIWIKLQACIIVPTHLSFALQICFPFLVFLFPCPAFPLLILDLYFPPFILEILNVTLSLYHSSKAIKDFICLSMLTRPIFGVNHKIVLIV